MRDVRDWNKYVEMASKAVKRAESVSRSSTALPATPAESESKLPEQPDLQPNLQNGHSAVHAATQPLPPRKGRGPRKQETIEELFARLTDPTLTLEETARMLQVCPTTVRRYTNKGILPHERSAGNQRRFKLSAVLAFLEAQSLVGTKEPLNTETEL